MRLVIIILVAVLLVAPGQSFYINALLRPAGRWIANRFAPSSAAPVSNVAVSRDHGHSAGGHSGIVHRLGVALDTSESADVAKEGNDILVLVPVLDDNNNNNSSALSPIHFVIPAELIEATYNLIKQGQYPENHTFYLSRFYTPPAPGDATDAPSGNEVIHSAGNFYTASPTAFEFTTVYEAEPDSTKQTKNPSTENVALYRPTESEVPFSLGPIVHDADIGANSSHENHDLSPRVAGVEGTPNTEVPDSYITTPAVIGSTFSELPTEDESNPTTIPTLTLEDLFNGLSNVPSKVRIDGEVFEVDSD